MGNNKLYSSTQIAAQHKYRPMFTALPSYFKITPKLDGWTMDKIYIYIYVRVCVCVCSQASTQIARYITGEYKK